MTTIATDGRSMAADSRCGGELFHTHVSKLSRADDGAILGSAGQAFDVSGFLDWYERGCDGAPNVTDGFEGLILKPDGKIICVDVKGRTFEHQAPAVVGSGCPFAYGALDAGASVAEAVTIAAKRDAFTSGEVTVFHLNPTETAASGGE